MSDGSDIVQEAIDDLNESVKDYKSTVCPVWATSVHRVLAELEHLRAQAPGWRGMESAPKDGRELLLSGPYPEYTNIKGRWVDIGTWWQDHWTIADMADRTAPTAWQPLPSPPAEGGE